MMRMADVSDVTFSGDIARGGCNMMSLLQLSSSLLLPQYMFYQINVTEQFARHFVANHCGQRPFKTMLLRMCEAGEFAHLLWCIKHNACYIAAHVVGYLPLGYPPLSLYGKIC